MFKVFSHRIAGREQTVNELYEKEKEHLLTMPDIVFSNLETSSGKVDKYATVVVDNIYVSQKVLKQMSYTSELE